MQIELIEILQRAEQGVTEPFICRASDGEIYFVKGKNARRSDLINEFICAAIGRSFGVPIPETRIIWSDPEFVKSTAKYFPDARVLGSGNVFGSRRVTDASEINVSDVDFVSPCDKECIAVFDLWVRNGDRNLSILGGNPNLLWSVSNQKIHAIDHNLAFDESVKPQELSEHIFIDSLREVATDVEKRSKFEEKFRRCYEMVEGLIVSVPEDWLFIDADLIDPADYDFDYVRGVLSAGWKRGFWDGF